LPDVAFREGAAEALPFADDAFDTVVCTHMLEHVQDLPRAIAELRRVASRRLVVVVPAQRPYRYTFDLHLHFFPYPSTLLAAMGPARRNSCRNVGGDLFYVEDL
jgi:ubiquinone/menaquinone biosynthesis C-methylase UbiE